jgi:hypothetical protein
MDSCPRGHRFLKESWREPVQLVGRCVPSRHVRHRGQERYRKRNSDGQLATATNRPYEVWRGALQLKRRQMSRIPDGAIAAQVSAHGAVACVIQHVVREMVFGRFRNARRQVHGEKHPPAEHYTKAHYRCSNVVGSPLRRRWHARSQRPVFVRCAAGLSR